MCGIVGYAGDRQAAGILVDGLEKLEYRGYDSAGVAMWQPEGLEVVHRVGKVVQNHHDGPALLCKALQKFHPLELCCTGNFGCQRRDQKGEETRAGVQNDHILIKFAHVLDDLVLALARLLENVPGR